MEDFSLLRDLMVKNQIEQRGIRDERILNVFRTTPRHAFVPPAYQNMAYQDRPLPIGDGQTISQPYIVALMTELINPQPDQSILEIGTGSGYQAAILSQLVKEVFSIERHPSLFQQTATLFKTLGYTNIHALYGDGSQGLPDEAPFDAILVTAAAPQIPSILLNQLKKQGKIIAPIGKRSSQTLVRWVKQTDGSLTKEELSAVAFVPLRGEYGWLEDEWPEDLTFPLLHKPTSDPLNLKDISAVSIFLNQITLKPYRNGLLQNTRKPFLPGFLTQTGFIV